MKTYIYQKKPLSINRRRRKVDMAKHAPSSKEESGDRRKKVRSGIIVKDYMDFPKKVDTVKSKLLIL